VTDIVARFGVERSLFASNFPVDSLVATYDEVVASFLAGVANLTPAEQRSIAHENAIRIYRLHRLEAAGSRGPR
jgi:predicted TIM-barrel fold metal-dependent hydrolase